MITEIQADEVKPASDDSEAKELDEDGLEDELIDLIGLEEEL